VDADVDVGMDVDDESIDEFLMLLVDQGFLHHDLQPPLVGRSPMTWMRERLKRFEQTATPLVSACCADLEAVAASCGEGDVHRAREQFRKVPAGSSDAGPDLHGVLVHQCLRTPRISRAAVERAAAVAPLLFRLQQAFSPPVAERALDAAILRSLDDITETFGAGALDLAAVATGGYGVALAGGAGDSDDSPRDARVRDGGTASPDLPAVAFVTGALVEAARTGAVEVDLDPAGLDVHLPPGAAPPTFEVVLSPAREPAGRAPGTGWLLGLHAPAGATFGRFCEALGPAAVAALRELAEAEMAAGTGEAAVDVAFAASAALADLSQHPPIRETALALLGWPEGPGFGVADLELVVDPSEPESIAWRRTSGAPIRPAPLHRVRSTTVPEGCYRLMAGWSFARQQAPWAFSWGPLAGLARLPRVSIDGFVIAPASWAMPPRGELERKGGLSRWRRRHGVPQVVQVGEGDELLYLDLGESVAAAELGRQATRASARVWEIWPPLGRLIGTPKNARRLEVVAAVINAPEEDDQVAFKRAAERRCEAGSVPPPARQPPVEDWVTFKIYGAEERQDTVLLGAVASAIEESRAGKPGARRSAAAPAITRWFFLRYRDPGSGRAHLRVRLAVSKAASSVGAIIDHMKIVLGHWRQSGDVTAVDIAEYHREAARYGGSEMMPAMEELFEIDSDLALAVLAAEAAAPEEQKSERRELMVRAFETLAKALAMAAADRRAFAQERRAAFADGARRSRADELSGALDAGYRRCSSRLMACLSGVGQDAFSPALVAYGHALRAFVTRLSRAEHAAILRALPALLHLTTVRLGAVGTDDEEAAFVFWERALEGLAARKRQA
jgi:thiopeptide-type bacteriocin biosynthesis protein